MDLENKNAVIYGAGGGIGRGTALAFAREGARLFLVGRTRDKLDVLAREVGALGGVAEVAVIDATDEDAVNEHVRVIAGRAGHLDISLNLISHGDHDVGGYVQGQPMTEIPAADFMRPFGKGLLSNYITARAAARQMVDQKSGVILTLTNAGSLGAIPMMGSTGTVAAAIETFARNMAAEVGPFGVRVLGVRIAAVPELWHHEIHTDVFEKDSGGLDQIGIETALANMSLLKRVTSLAQVVETLTFLASDKAGGMTAAFANVTAGLVVG